MSQQKVLIAICLVAGLVALTSAQMLDPMQCAQKARLQVDKYTQTVGTSVRDLTQRLMSTGSQAADISEFSQISDQLMQELQKLGQQSQGFNFATYMEGYQRIVALQTRLGTYLLTHPTALGMRTMETYMKFGNDLMAANTDFFMNLARGCVPNSSSY